MLKRSLVIAVLMLFVMAGVVFGADEPGKLSVITDMDDAYIYIDGTMVGKSFIKDYQLDAGSHYLMVKLNDKKIYAETVNIYPGQVRTIPTSHFVDIKTSTPNRGALDVEAARIRETRGNGAFGAYVGTPAGGISYKYWVYNPFGIQVIGLAMSTNDFQETQFGVRLLYNLGTKIMFEQPMEAYWALGTGNKWYDDKTPANNDVLASVQELALGLEFGIGNIFFSGETGFEMVNNSGTSTTNMKISGGIHYYF